MMKRAAAIQLPLFSLSTDDDLGRGEILDLLPFAQWMLETGHRMLQLLPLSESGAHENSPYSALSVFSIDPLYISVGALPGVPAAELQRARAQLRGRLRVPRSELRALKLPLLEAAFRHFQACAEDHERHAFEAFAADNRQWLDDYALFRALKEKFGWAGWEQWPSEVKDRKPDALAAAGRELHQAIAMYQYWQFLAGRQWTQVRRELQASGVRLIGDLAFLPARDSADVWAGRDLFLPDRMVGAPPDAFNAKGQRWGLPMPNWPRMRADDLKWWRSRAHRAAVLFDLLRIDHAVGFYRTFFFSADPNAAGAFYPAEEGQQREQGEAFFTMLKQEVGQDTLIGEDLGTIPPWVRASLTALGVAGLKVFRWEKTGWGTTNEHFIPPAQYPELSVAVTSTHDTETVASWWRHTAPAERQKLAAAMDFAPALDISAPKLDRALLDAILNPLFASPSCLMMASLQDLFGWEQRINLPGSIRKTNWTYRMPMTIERLNRSPRMRARAATLRRMAQESGRL